MTKMLRSIFIWIAEKFYKFYNSSLKMKIAVKPRMLRLWIRRSYSIASYPFTFSFVSFLLKIPLRSET